PFPVTGVFECEFQMALENRTGTFTDIYVHQKDEMLPSQVEQERSNLNMDWRKRVVFHATLAPAQMNRFDCRLELKQHKPEIALQKTNDKIVFKTDDIHFVINTKTGFVDKYEINGFNFLRENALRPIVMMDSPDSWGESVTSFPELAGEFKLASSEEVNLFAGLPACSIDPIHVIEDGNVRSVIEVALKYNHSVIWQRYKLPKRGTEVEVEIRVLWNEKDRMLKFSVPTRLQNAEYLGQVAYGVQKLPMNGDEAVAQKWVAVASPEHDLALTCINDSIYGSDYKDGELRLSLLRSPAYSALPIGDREIIPRDRYIPRMDQGEHLYRFWFNAGQLKDRMEAIDREALVKNETPVVLSFFPSGKGKKNDPAVILSDSAVQITAIKLAEDNDDLIIRLFEPTGQKRTTQLSLPALSFSQEITLHPFEIITVRINTTSGKALFVDLLENEPSAGESL
ncbi:MAG: alpha-mannosidase, partial [Actinobacteria bacterium]|nr:alpha-mannosidase [Actinomycetota bacterium]